VAGDGTDGVVTGMAPDAELMVLGINCSPPDSIGWEASDYAIANGAHIITESYIWPWSEDTPDFEGWRRQTDAELAAGVIHANAAGNDCDAGNGDLMLDPGERVEMAITLQSRTDTAVEGLEAILSTSTPGVTIHNQHATYPTLPARGTTISDPPHYSLSIHAATLYRIERTISPTGSFAEAGSATVPRWVDVDALGASESYYYRVYAENAGGGE
jgi:hypothetical protein